MIAITGDVLIKQGNMEQAMQICQKHVAHTLTHTEIGSIGIAVYLDPVNALGLFF